MAATMGGAAAGAQGGPLPGRPRLQGKADSRKATITVTARVEPTVRARPAECLEEIAVGQNFNPTEVVGGILEH